MGSQEGSFFKRGIPGLQVVIVVRCHCSPTEVEKLFLSALVGSTEPREEDGGSTRELFWSKKANQHNERHAQVPKPCPFCTSLLVSLPIRTTLTCIAPWVNRHFLFHSTCMRLHRFVTIAVRVLFLSLGSLLAVFLSVFFFIYLYLFWDICICL